MFVLLTLTALMLLVVAVLERKKGRVGVSSLTFLTKFDTIRR